MSTKILDKAGLEYLWTKLKAYFAPKAHTHNAFETKHSYTVAANAAKNWYRIANANTSPLDMTKPIHVQFILTAYNDYGPGDCERWFINADVFGRNAHVVVFGSANFPFSQVRILYENTTSDLDANDKPALDLYLNYVYPNYTTKIEIEEIYNNGSWTFVANGQLAASTVPSGFENVVCSVRNNGVERSTYADYVPYLNRQISNFTAAFTLADSYLYRSRTLNCTGTFTITIPSINSGYMWCVIKNKNTSSGVITLHPSTISVLIDGSNADITLQPMEYVCIHSAGANNYSLIADGRWKFQKADKATTLAGYGITDAKIANGTITLGSNSITPITSHQTLPTLSRTISGSGNAITDITVSGHAITATKGATYITSSGSITGNAATATKLATARDISAGNLEFQGSANFDGSGNIALNVTNHRCIVSVSTTNNYLFHRIAYISTLTNNYIDRGITFLVSKDFYSGGWGICRIVFRTNNATGGYAAQCNVQWLVRSGEISADSIQVGFCNTASASYIDVFYKSTGTYNSAVCRVLAHSDGRNSVGRGFTVVSASTEASNTTATDPKTSVESYKTIADAGTALHSQSYTNIIAASDAGVTGNAGKLATARKINGVSFDGSANITLTAVVSSASRSADIAANGTFTVPSYIVGAQALLVYLDGCLSRQGDGWSEVGTAGAASTTIKFLQLIPKDMEIVVRVN